jgi:leader peptidase (prepilin peptidase) / N-methyltransferase
MKSWLLGQKKGIGLLDGILSDWWVQLPLILGLGALSLADVRHGRLPNSLTLPLIALGLTVSWSEGNLVQSFLGVIVGYGSFVAVETLFRTVRGYDGLGRGDAKLLAVGGAWCGWSLLPFVVLIGSLLALLFVSIMALTREGTIGAKTKIRFGPFLSFSIAWVWLVW